MGTASAEEKKPIDPQLLKDATQALKVAKIALMMQKNTIFYTTILFSMKQFITDDIPTAATDGLNLYVNPQFFMDMSPNERLSLLCHEILHVAFDHMHRQGERNHELWNVAGDFVINGFLKNAHYLLPDGALLNNDYNGKTTEEVYAILDKKTEEYKKKLIDQLNNGSFTGQDIQYPENTPNAKGVSKDDVTKIVLRAATQAKAMGQPAGSVPGEVSIELQRTLNPPLPWYVILRNYLTDFAKNDYSFKRPNRRFLPDYYLPTAHSEAIPNIAIAVDTSGSVSTKQFNTFITKIDEIQQTMKPKKITVISFDTKIKSEQELLEDQNPFETLTFKGRGGTRINPVHEWVKDNRPSLLIVFSDGQFSQTKPAINTVPIFWVIHNNPGWESKVGGKTIHYNIAR